MTKYKDETEQPFFSGLVYKNLIYHNLSLVRISILVNTKPWIFAQAFEITWSVSQWYNYP